MSIFKCKMCGGDLEVTGEEKVVECEYCGSKQTVPNADDEKKVKLFNRANRLRMSCEFDKAAGIYEQIVAEFPEEAEAYWGLCLANYGIEYVDDPATGDKIPTCHRASFEKMRKDENYELALENADMAARIVYEEQAKEIDRIMGDILAISRDEKPYDVFICYKETDSSGSRTLDSVLAQEIYDALCTKNYRVFFSRITLEDKLGTQYEPYIFSALNSAKMMLVVGTDYEYMNAVWVKNEWSRFIKLMAKDKAKVLIPCYKDMDPYDMPDEFRAYQSQDMGKVGAMQDLTRGIDKIFGKNNTVKPSGPEHTVMKQAEVENLLKRMFMFLEDGDWTSAKEYSNKVLDMDASNAEAYLGALMAEERVRTRGELKDCEDTFASSNNYKKILRFADEALKNELENCNRFIEERNKEEQKKSDYEAVVEEMNKADSESAYLDASKKFESMSGYQDADELTKQCIYQAAMCAYNRADSESAYLDASKKFESMSGYQDADELAKQCTYRAAICIFNNASTEQAFTRVRELFLSLGDYLEAKDYAEKCRLSFEDAYDLLRRYRLSLSIKTIENRIGKLQGEIADLNQKRQTLPNLFEKIDDMRAKVYSDNDKLTKYKEEKNSLIERKEKLGFFAGKEKKRIDERLAVLDNEIPALIEKIAGMDDEFNKLRPQLSGYDTMQQLDEHAEHIQTALIEARKKLDDAREAEFNNDDPEALKDEVLSHAECIKVVCANKAEPLPLILLEPGCEITFGHYHENTDSDLAPIEWLVLDKDNDKILVISKYALDCQEYDTSYTNATWENCSLRKWMNSTFFNNAFSTEEQAQVQNTIVSANINPEYSANPCDTITDKVFLLSVAEVDKYFSSDSARTCKPTKYAVANGANVNSDNGNCWWCLRSSYAAFIDIDGAVNCGISKDNAVRPAMWISF